MTIDATRTSVAEVLSKTGVEPELLALLVPLVAAPLPGTFEPAELEQGSEGQLALLAAIVSAQELGRFGAALPLLLDFVASRAESLALLDHGRLWHLKGLAAWRLKDSLYVATQALNHSIAVLVEAGTAPARDYLARVFDTYGQLLQYQGLLQDARHEFEGALQLKVASGDEAGAALTLGNLGRLCMELGNFESARQYLQRDLAIVERLSPQSTRLQAQLWCHLGVCAIEMQRGEEASELFRRSAELGVADQNAVAQVFAELGLARVELLADRLATAQDLLTAAERLLTGGGIPEGLDRELRGTVSQLRAESALRAGDAREALRFFQRAREQLLGAPSVSPVETAHLLRGYARASRANGEFDRASRLFREALQCLDATAADALREAIETELRDHSRDSWLLHSAGRFVGGPGHIEFLLTEAGRGGFRGQSWPVAVLFSDIRGFTGISEHFSADSLILFLNDYLRHMTRCVEQCGGMVDKFIGDAVMALFSLPEPQANDAERACRAALMMRAELERFNRKMPAGTPALAIGIGVHFGEVVAGLIGSPQKRSYTVIGDAVNTASRMESMTKQLGASILVSQEIVTRLPHPDHFLLRPLGSYRPKGRGQAITVFDLMGEQANAPFARELRHEIEQVQTALAQFQARQFTRAVGAFWDLARSVEKERRTAGYVLLAEHTTELLRTPPPPDWEGAIVLTEK